MPGNRCINVENDVNVKAFLKLIRYAEHYREDDSVYYILYGGQRTFTDTSKHPLDKPIPAWGRQSTASGAYQIIYATWNQAKKESIASDFTPASQDRIAVWLIQRSGAMRYIIDGGDIEKAIPYLRGQWASLPGASQSRMTMIQARQQFDKYAREYGHR